VKQNLKIIGLLPNKATSPSPQVIPLLKIYIEDEDLESLFTRRTNNERYKGVLEIQYPDGNHLKHPILIKTRGNATRGYIKSSFTIESFNDFKENKTFDGDEFLEGGNEFKLRSFINEETMIHEKLFYDTFKKLGHPAPDFFDTTLEVNGIPLGLYQVTEPIKKLFFKRRNIETKNYFYAQNSGSIYNTNLKFYHSSKTTASQYKIRGDEKTLLNFIKSLDRNDPKAISTINTKNVFDYALLTFLANARDSLTHNYYVYLDEKTKQWNMFPWDADAAFADMPSFAHEKFSDYTKKNDDIFNNLIYYIFQNIAPEAKDNLFNEFKTKWNQEINLLQSIESYQKKYLHYYQFDNKLWNGIFLERKQDTFNTPAAIERLKEEINPLLNLSFDS